MKNTRRWEKEIRQIGPNIKRIRLEKGLNKPELVRSLGVTPRVWNDWESGRKTPSLPHLIGIANALGTSLDDLIPRIR